jgi:molecular chaperone GrpE (heat shock protein)
MFKTVVDFFKRFIKRQEQNRAPWKQVILENCKQWLANLPDEEPPDYTGEALSVSPDMYTFYSELCAARAEQKKAFIRNNDALKNLDTAIEEVRHFIEKSVQKNNTLEADNARHTQETVFRPLAAIVERFERIREKLRHPPKTRFITFSRPWRTSWNTVEEGFALVRMHLEEFLFAAGVCRIKTVGEQFDPYTMTAVSAEETDAYPPNSVIEEISPGFLCNGSVLTPAAVKVARSKGSV